jgi:hypothetical protein
MEAPADSAISRSSILFVLLLCFLYLKTELSRSTAERTVHMLRDQRGNSVEEAILT